jgi:hypothetical protein
MLLMLAGTSSDATAATSTRIEREFDEAIVLCNRVRLPNSMAQSEEVDRDARMRRLAERRGALARSLADRDGIAYLNQRLAATNDELDSRCVAELLSDAKAAMTEQ